MEHLWTSLLLCSSAYRLYCSLELIMYSYTAITVFKPYHSVLIIGVGKKKLVQGIENY